MDASNRSTGSKDLQKALVCCVVLQFGNKNSSALAAMLWDLRLFRMCYVWVGTGRKKKRVQQISVRARNAQEIAKPLSVCIFVLGADKFVLGRRCRKKTTKNRDGDEMRRRVNDKWERPCHDALTNRFVFAAQNADDRG